ncbi:MAG: hypothetical protein PWP23_2715 [Candidatus Sumerlaeota bacterium]|nr:hypothetical protein [Candidatus Sumerlaeota bacterium]
MQEDEQELRDQIKDLIRAKKYDELESVWLQIAEDSARSLNFHESVIRYLHNRKELERLAELYTVLINLRLDQGNTTQALAVSNLILEVEPTAEFLRPLLIRTLKAIYADRDEARVAELLRLSGLDGETPNLQQALSRAEDLFGASRGQVFRHTQWGLGVVQEFDARDGIAIINFQRKPNHRMTMEGLKNFLRRVPSEHIQARIATAPEEARAEAFENPAATVRHALKGFGGKMAAADLKRLFIGDLMTEADYKRWWSKAKDEIRTDPYLDLKGMGANAQLILRSEPRSFVDEILEGFLRAKNTIERRKVLRDVARHGDNADMTPEDIDRLFLLFKKPLDDGAIKTDYEKFGHGILFEEYAHLFRDDVKNPIDIEFYLTHPELKPGDLIISLGIFELQRIALQHVVTLREAEIEEIFTEVFFGADPKLVEWMEKTLEARGRQGVLDHCMERVLAHPERNIDLFTWAGRKVIEGKLPHVEESFHPLAICQSASTLLSDAEEDVRASGAVDSRKASAPGAVIAARMRTILQDGHGKLLKIALRKADVEQARRFLAHIKMLSGLSNQLRSMIEELILLEHPTLRKRTTHEEKAEAESTKIHYALMDSVERKRKELSHILSVEIPENTVAIGTAREHGDLRENAEYHAAKDRQKILMQRAADLEDLIARARIIELENVKTDQVRFGTRVTLDRLDEQAQETVTIMGMWEANADLGILSYMTPFGSQLLGRKLNEQFEVTLPDGRRVEYKVVRIEKADAPVHQA